MVVLAMADGVKVSGVRWRGGGGGNGRYGGAEWYGGQSGGDGGTVGVGGTDGDGTDKGGSAFGFGVAARAGGSRASKRPCSCNLAWSRSCRLLCSLTSNANRPRKGLGSLPAITDMARATSFLPFASA